MVTERQIAALKYMIFIAKNANELTKRVLTFLIDNSEQLTKDVCLTLITDQNGFTEKEVTEIGFGMSAMCSSNCTTHLHELFVLMGSELIPDIHYGDFDPNRAGDKFSAAGQFAGAASLSQVTHPGLIKSGMPMRYTVWLSRERYSRDAEFLPVTHEDLDKVDLSEPNLYEEVARKLVARLLR